MSNLNAVSKEKTENPKSKQKFLNVSLKLDRNLSIFDYKAIFAIGNIIFEIRNTNLFRSTLKC